jgi:hypothetical protein
MMGTCWKASNRSMRKEIEMRTVHHSRMSFLGIAAVLVGTLVTPLAVGAEDQNHATISAPGPSEVEASRAIIAERALLSGDLGSVQEQALADVMAAATAEDDTTGSDALEAARGAPLAQFRAVEWSLSDSLDLGSMQEQALAERLAHFRTIELSLSRSLGAGHQETSACEIVA